MKNKKGIITEFKEFIARGNVMELAVAVIIGGAFQKIINSFVNDLIMPVIGVITGGVDFSGLFIVLDGKSYATAAAAKEAGAATLNYGTFITVVIDFLLIALVVFLMVRSVNKLAAYGKKPEQPKPGRKCPYCLSEIDDKATRCPHCTSRLE